QSREGGIRITGCLPRIPARAPCHDPRAKLLVSPGGSEPAEIPEDFRGPGGGLSESDSAGVSFGEACLRCGTDGSGIAGPPTDALNRLGLVDTIAVAAA